MIKTVDKRILKHLAAMRQPFRGRVLAMNTKPDVSLMQVAGLSGETLQATEYFQHFGFTSVPPVGTQVIVLPIGGSTAQAVIMASENGANRVKQLASGEVAIYSAKGSTVILHADGSIAVNTGNNGKVTVNSPEMDITTSGKVNISASEVDVSCDVVISGKSFLQHVHGGVQSGTSQTGVPS